MYNPKLDWYIHTFRICDIDIVYTIPIYIAIGKGFKILNIRKKYLSFKIDGLKFKQ